MKKTFKRIFASLLVVLMVVTTVPLAQLSNLDFSEFIDDLGLKAASASAKAFAVYSKEEQELFKLLNFDPGSVFTSIDFGDTEVELPLIPVNGQEYSMGTFELSASLPFDTCFKYNVDFENKKIEITFGYDRDESAYIGPEGQSSGHWKESYDEVKNLYQSVTGNKVSTTDLWNKFNNLKGKVQAVNGSLGIDVGASICGYAQFSYADNNVSFNEGGIVVGVEASTSFQTYPAPAIYVGFKLSGGATGKIGVSYENSVLSYAGSVDIELAAGIMVGVGEKKAIKTYAEAGVTGKFNAGIKCYPESSSNESGYYCTLSGEVYSDTEILGFSACSYTWPLGTVQLYPKTTNEKEISDTDKPYTHADPAVLPRDYATSTLDDSDNFALDNIYSGTDYDILTLSNGNVIMVWSGDDKTDSIEDRSSIFYSIYDGNEWSESVKISEGEYYDCYPQVVEYNNNIYFFWQRTNYSLSGDSYSQALENSEIVYSVYDGSSLSNPVSIKETENSIAELGYTLKVVNDELVVSWIENSENNIYYLEGVNSLYKETIDKNNVTEISKIVEAEDYISDFAFDDNGDIIYSVVKSDESNVYLNNTVIIHSEDRISNITYNAGKLIYLDDTTLKVYDFTTKATDELLNNILNGYEIVKKDSGFAIVVSTNDNDRYRLLVSEYDNSTGKIGDFVEYYCSDKYIHNWETIEYNDDYMISLLESNFDLNADEIFSDYDLKVVGKQNRKNISVTNNYAWNYGNVIEGQTSEIYFEVANSGNVKVDTVDYQLIDESTNEVVTSGQLDLNLPGDSSEKYSVNYVAPDNFSGRNLRLEIDCDDEDTSDNYAIAELGKTDLEITDLTKSYKDGKYYVTADIVNDGFVEAENSKVVIYDKNKNGDIISETSIDNIAAQGDVKIDIEVPESYVYAAGEDEYYDLLAVVETSSEEDDVANNEMGLVYNDDEWRAVIAQNSSEEDVVDVVVAEELFDGFSTELIDKVSDAMFNLESSVDISGYQVSSDNIVALISAVQKYYPTEYTALTISDFSYKAILNTDGDIVNKLRFYYGDDVSLSVVQKRAKDMQNEINKIVAKTEGMDDFEKALFVHDYLVLNAEYDLDLLDMMEKGQMTTEIYNERYTGYSILVNGTGVCGSYALAYRAVMNACGVECLYVSSSEMNHAWNLVKIGDNWYHVDCTWDDPTPDTFGRARRTYFLLTDEEIMKLSHYSWTPGQYKATDTTYSEMPRDYDIYQKYDYSENIWYCLNGSKLYTYDTYGDNENELTTITAQSISVDDGNLYYSKGREIYKWDSSTNESGLVYKIPKAKSGSSPNKAYIMNMYVDGDSVEIYKTIYDESGNQNTLYEVGLLSSQSYATVNGIKLDKDSLSLDVFENNTITSTVLTSDGGTAEAEVDWTSSNESIVSVENGKITANNVGTAVVTASIGLYSASCEVTVTGNGLTGSCGDNAVWTFDVDSNTLTISGSGKMDDFSESYRPWDTLSAPIYTVKIIDGISSVGDYSFLYYQTIKKVVLCDTITSIKFDAFCGCTGISNLIIGNSVTYIGRYAFEGCSGLTSITIPDSVTSIDAYSFKDCTSLESINIPDGVTSIGSNAFEGCSGFTSITVNENNTVYDSRNNCNAIIVISTNELIRGCKNTIIPDSVTSIGNYAFYGCSSLTDITIPDSVTSIDAYSFQDCTSLESINIPGSVTSIGSCAFENCTGLVSITIPDSVTSMGTNPLRSCSNLAQIIVDESNSVYDSRNNCNAIIGTRTNELIVGCKNTIIPDSVTSIGNYAFYGCSGLTSITIPNSVTSIGGRAFRDCSSLKNIIISSGVISIGEYSFYGTGLTSITIPDSVTSIGDSAFYNCSSLESITVDVNNTVYDSRNNCNAIIETSTNKLILGCANTVIPNSVTSIGDYAFYRCSGLTSITVPDSVTSIGTYAFVGCSNLVKIIVDANNSVYDSRNDCNAIIETSTNKLIFGSQNTDIDETVESIGSNAFAYQDELLYITVNDNCSSVSSSAFTNCSNLKNVILSDNITSFDSQMVESCDNLNKIYICNSECEMSIGSTFFYALPKNVIIYGHENSTAQKYAARLGNSFVNVDAEPHVHDYFLTSYKKATKSNDGYETWTCYRGDDSYQDTLHYFGDEETVEATCTEDGYKSKTCVNCGYTEITETIKCAGKHNYELIESVEATCTTDGSKTYKCSACGDTYTKVISADDGHQMVETVTEPTCTTKGYTTAVCSRCGETMMYNFTSPTGHKLKITGTTENCSAHGSKIYSCSKCDYTETVAIDASNLETETVVTPATCTKSGLSKEVCKLCGATISSEIIAATGHQYEDKYTIDTAATCTETGSKSRHCSVCDSKGYVETIPVLGHSSDDGTITTEPTCTEDGVKTYKCTSCGEVLKTEAVAATGHKSDAGTVTKAATCTAEGVKTYKCTVCGEVLKTESIAKIAHKYVAAVTKPTCTAEGYTTYTCSACGDTYRADTVSATGHTSDKGTVTKSATCTATGTKTYKCTACGETIKTETIAKTAHTEVAIPAVAATCTSTGLTAGKICSVCGTITQAQKTVAKTSHTDSNNDGVCDNCGTTLTQDNPSKNCSCNCHKSGFAGFIWKIQRFFYKLFKTHKYCSCGTAHY